MRGLAADGNQCSARGFQVTVKISSVGAGKPCPQLPSSLPTTVKQANTAINCKSLSEQDSTLVGCAAVTNCVDGKSESPYFDSATLSGPDGACIVSLGRPDILLTEASANSLAEQLRALQTTPVSALPDALRDVVLTHPAVAGVGEVWARVVTEYPAGPEGANARVERHFRGALAANGAFSLDVPYRVVDEDGEVDTVTEALWFDGASDTTDVAPSSGRVTVVESYPQFQSPGGAGRTIYTIDTSEGVAHPLCIEVVDEDGRTLRRTSFEDYRALADGVCRPYRIVKEHFDFGATAPSIVTTTSIRSARSLAAAQLQSALVRTRSAVNWWFVRL